MRSMTGYGWAEKQDGGFFLSVEIKGYNNRFLDISVNLPSFLSVLEAPVRDYLGTLCRRGTVETAVRYREMNTPVNVLVNREAAQAYYAAAEQLCTALGLAEKPDLRTIIAMDNAASGGGIIEVERNRDTDRAWSRIKPLLEKAAVDFCAARDREGARTGADILSHLETLEKSQAAAESYSAVLDETLKASVKTRFLELLGNAVDENRVLSETAALLIKYTISEEIFRLKSHLGEFRLLAASSKEEGVGKKLDFLCQEINREINTIGSKASLLEVSREVVRMKDALENIREQLRNIE